MSISIHTQIDTLDPLSNSRNVIQAAALNGAIRHIFQNGDQILYT